MSQSVTAREEETRKRILVQEQNTELRANIDTLRVQVCGVFYLIE